MASRIHFFKKHLFTTVLWACGKIIRMKKNTYIYNNKGSSLVIKNKKYGDYIHLIEIYVSYWIMNNDLDEPNMYCMYVLYYVFMWGQT